MEIPADIFQRALDQIYKIPAQNMSEPTTTANGCHESWIFT